MRRVLVVVTALCLGFAVGCGGFASLRARDGHADTWHGESLRVRYATTYGSRCFLAPCDAGQSDDEREKSGRKRGEGPKLAPGALPMFKAQAKALSAEQVGKYAIRFAWNDNHDLGIYSWAYLREICPCGECRGEVR